VVFGVRGEKEKEKEKEKKTTLKSEHRVTGNCRRSTIFRRKIIHTASTLQYYTVR